MDLEEIIVNLRVLNKLDKHQKLITRGAYLNIESPSLIPESVRRWNRQENRFETIKKINAVVNAAITNVKKTDIVGQVTVTQCKTVSV